MKKCTNYKTELIIVLMLAFFVVVLNALNIYKMKQIIDKFLIKRSIRPYKVVPLSTGVIVEHYRNGKLKTEYYGLV